MTTNHIEKLDPAIIRKGRVDLIAELPLIRPEVVCEHFCKSYPDLTPSSLEKWPTLKACDINGIKFEAKEDSSKVLNLLRLDNHVT